MKEFEIVTELSDFEKHKTDNSLEDKDSILPTSNLQNIKNKSFTINMCAFGYKYGVPTESDFVFDVRCFENPFYVDELKEKTGLDRCVREYVLKFDETKEFVKKLEELMLFLIPLYINKGKTELTISIGCTGGRHRSVTILLELGEILKNNGYIVNFIYRDLKK